MVNIYCKAYDLCSTYDHRTMNTELPVRSAVLKHCTGGLVVRWVTTSESPLLYVFVFAAFARSYLPRLLDRQYIAHLVAAF
jgi:hypothetical protein